jgi:hypothetical protein
MTQLTGIFDGVEQKYFYCYRLEDYDSLLTTLENSNKYKRLGLDIETYTLPKWKGKFKKGALDEWTGRISTLTIVSDGFIPIVFDLIILRLKGFNSDRLYDYLESREALIAHRAQFEIKWLAHDFNRKFLRNFKCTMIMSNIIGNASGSKFGKSIGHSLKNLARDLLNVKITGKGKEQITDWEPRPTGLVNNDLFNYETEADAVTWKSKLDYAASDTLYLLPIFDALYEVLANPLPPSPILTGSSASSGDNVLELIGEQKYGLGQLKVYNLEMEMLAVSARMEHVGMPINESMLRKFQEGILSVSDNTGELLDVTVELCKEFNLEYFEDIFGDGYEIPKDSEKALNNPIKLKALLQKHLGLENLDSSQTSVIVRLLDLLDQAERLDEVNFSSNDEERIYEGIQELSSSAIVKTSRIAQLVIKYKTLKKVHGMNLIKHINPETGCIHSSFSQAWAATGRSASSNPNQQNIAGRCYVKIGIDSKCKNPFQEG